jgi:LuxR family quorum sensing-dependent transcriptional regulator
MQKSRIVVLEKGNQSMTTLAGLDHLEHDLENFLDQLKLARNIEDCGPVIADYFRSHDLDLLFFSLVDRLERSDPIHIHTHIPEDVELLCQEFEKRGGCPILREAVKTNIAFDALNHDFSSYDDDLNTQYLHAFSNLGHRGILVIPVNISAATVLFVIGLNNCYADNIKLVSLLQSIITQIVTQIILSFDHSIPFLTENMLTAREKECLIHSAKGIYEAEVAHRLGISPHTVRVHIENAKRKLGAKNKVHAVALAISMGELSANELR